MRRALSLTVILTTVLGVCSCESLPGYREPALAEKALFSKIGTHVLPAERTLEMTCEVTVSEIPTGTKEVRVWIPFPQANAHQTLIEPTITHPTTYRPIIRHDERYGSQVLYVSGEAPLPERFTVSCVTRVGRARMDHHRIVPPPPVDDNTLRAHFSPDLEPVHIAPFDGENLSDDERKKQLAAHRTWIEMKVAEVIAFGASDDDNVPAGARGVTAPDDTRIDDFNRARAVYDWVLYTLEPDNVPRGGPRRTVKEILDEGRGDASDYALVTVALLRAVGIPARVAGGVMLDENRSPDLTDAASPAAWVRFVVNGRAWSACDPWTADRCPELRDYMFRGLCANRVQLWSGPRPQLVPAPKEGPPVVFDGAFAEADEKPVRTDTVVRFRDVSP